MKPKIVVGMSGGVDSSISVLLLKKRGWQPVGVSLKLAHWKSKSNILKENVCCTTESLDIAKNVCKKLNVPYYRYDVSKEFKKNVMDYFISELKKTRTPNPCAICNRYLKFKKLFEWAKKHNIKYVATGHYAKTRFNKKTKEYEMLRPKDTKKDQTYGLCLLPQKWLKHIVFPLADYTKDEVYKIAEEEGFKIFLKRKQSQDLCFVSGNALPSYIKDEIGENPGLIKDDTGKILGNHKGLHFYTIGQRRNLGLTKKYYVKEINAKTNTLTVTENPNKICSKKLFLHPFNFMLPKVPNKIIRVLAKTRYQQPLSKAMIYPPKNGKVKVVFNKPQKSVTSGQVCTLYKNNVCLGGGIINLE